MVGVRGVADSRHHGGAGHPSPSPRVTRLGESATASGEALEYRGAAVSAPGQTTGTRAGTRIHSEAEASRHGKHLGALEEVSSGPHQAELARRFSRGGRGRT